MSDAVELVVAADRIPPGVNALSAPLLAALLRQHEELGIDCRTLANGCRLVDAGIEVRGSLEAGRRIAEICLGGLGHVSLGMNTGLAGWPLGVSVYTSSPVIACLGCQYAGWSLAHGEGKEAFHALGSGPGRVLAQKEPLFEELGYTEKAEQTCLVLEVDKQPPQALVDKIARTCGVAISDLTLILTPTSSLAGNVQIVSRVLEVALHKTHELGFSLGNVIDGAGSAPLPPPAPDFLTAMGRTNDAILFGGQVQLYVSGADDDARELAHQLPSSASGDYGRPFADVFKACDYDFFKIDPMLFSPASVIVTALDSGKTFRGGRLDLDLLNTSFGS